MKLECCENRLKSMMVMNKQEKPQKINRLLKSEILFLLKNYFDITADDLSFDIAVNEFGKYVIQINAECRNMIIAQTFNR